MTRDNFVRNVTTWADLLDLCSEEGCEVCADVYSDGELDELICEQIVDLTRNEVWSEIRDRLNRIDAGYDYYVNYGDLDIDGLDAYDFETYKQEVCEWMDEYVRWDTEGDDPPEEEVTPQASDEPYDEAPPQEPFSIGDLMAMCNADAIQLRKARQEQASASLFAGMPCLYTAAAAC